MIEVVDLGVVDGEVLFPVDAHGERRIHVDDLRIPGAGVALLIELVLEDLPAFRWGRLPTAGLETFPPIAGTCLEEPCP